MLADRWVVVPALGSFTASVLLHGSMCTVLSAEWGMRLVTGLASHFLGTFVAMPTASLEVEWANGNGSVQFSSVHRFVMSTTQPDT